MTQVSKKENSDSRRFSRMQWRVLIATMIGYTLFYFMRKNFSFAMPGLEQDCGISKSQLGNFLFWGGIIYGLSKFLNGIIGDRVNSPGINSLSCVQERLPGMCTVVLMYQQEPRNNPGVHR